MKSHLQFHLVPAFGRMKRLIVALDLRILDEIGQERVQESVGKLAKARSRHTIQRLFSGWRKSGAARWQDSSKGILSFRAQNR
jgi:hypothetical protein